MKPTLNPDRYASYGLSGAMGCFYGLGCGRVSLGRCLPE